MHARGFFRYVMCWRIFACALFLTFFFCISTASASTISTYSDRLSDSGPGEPSNHTINFTTTAPIPADGFIRLVLDPDDFTIPALDFDIDNVALYVATSSGYMLRAAAVAPSATEDGVSITAGNSGVIEITLNSTDGIPSGAQVRILLGTNAPNATSTDAAIVNPSVPGTYTYYLDVGSDMSSSRATGYYAITEHVTVGNIDTRETIPPRRFNGAPAGELSGTSILVQMSLETNEFSKCRYSTTPDVGFFSMGNEFTSRYTTIHSKNISVTALASSSNPYTFYVRCIDDEGNINIDDYVISFSILPIPTGTPGDSGTNQGTGSGTGEGSGDADPGNGDPSGNDNASGGSSGGGGGGGGGGGTGSSSGGSGGSGGFEGTDKPYQSGDGLVIITGYAFPRSTVVALVDGQVADNVTSNGDGSFSITLDQIARGAYTFGVYGIDRGGVKSSTFSTTFTVTGSRGTTLSNINVMPSIKVTPNPAQPNSTVKVSGYTIPSATVTIENQNDKSSATLKTFTTTSDGNGAWSVDISTDGFAVGNYKVRAKAKQEATSISTNFSGFTFYGVGQAATVGRPSDLNRDGKVNLVDFSILLFWWNSDGGNSNPPADINGDGKVSLTDFSIMIFNWTG